MDFNTFQGKIADFFKKLSNFGVPVIFIRDPITQKPSVSLSLLVASFILVCIGLAGKWSKMIGGIDTSDSLQLLYATSALYFGRKFTSPNKTEINSGQDKQ